MQILNIILASQSSGMQQMLIMLAMFVALYFFMIRPQQKKMKEQKKYQESIKVGDSVVTNSGIHGKIESMEGTTAIISSASSRLKIELSSINAELSAPLNKTA